MKIVLAATGTGGHIMPALNVAIYLKNEDSSHNIHWVSTPQGMENAIVKSHNISTHCVAFSGVRKKGLLRWFGLPFSLLKAIHQARKILRSLKPDIVLVMGGYLAVPVAVASRLQNIPLVVHEQNVIVGLANKIVSLFATKVCYAFEGSFPSQSKDRFIHTGNPVAAELYLKKQNKTTAKTKKCFHILVLGGSLGAQSINTILPKALAELQKKIPHSLTITHQCGQNNLQQTQRQYQQTSLQHNVIAFSPSLFECYQQADLIVARAGAMSVAEISLVGCPALFIPYPFAVDDHQYHNAQSLIKSTDNKEHYLIVRDENLQAKKVTQSLYSLYQVAQKKPFLTTKSVHADAAKNLVDVMKTVTGCS